MLEKLRLNGAEVLAGALVDSGVHAIFGIPGVHNLVLFEALRRSGIHIVPTTHEQGAGFMANGYGRVTGKPGVFITVPGPGLTNALTPIAEALVDSTPLLAIVTNVPQSEKTFQMHEIDQTRLLTPMVKSVHDVVRATDISSALDAALKETTSGEPGPCVLQIPSNLFWERVESSKINETKNRSEPPKAAEQIETIATRMKSARRLGLLVGLGAADAMMEVRMLADWMNAPVASTGSGRGVMDEAHPLSMGFGWMGESVDSVNRILESCDLVLAIGVRFSQTGTHDYRLKINCPLIHVDASPAVLGKNYGAEIELAMDAGAFIRELLRYKKHLGPREDDGLREMIRSERMVCEERLRNDESVTLKIGEKELSPSVFFGELRKLLSPDSILVTDAGFNERLTLHHWTVHQPRTLINPSDYESMGFAIPTAIGAAFAFPKRKVVVIVGDGGLVMSGLELMTAVREKINLTVIVLNNDGFGVIKKIQEDMFGTSVAVDVGAPNFKALAESIHINMQPDERGILALERALSNNLPTLLEVKMRYNEQDDRSNRRKRLKNDVKQTLQKFTGLR
jgi:acetolactate synthase-1/2/3 large subunit